MTYDEKIRNYEKEKEKAKALRRKSEDKGNEIKRLMVAEEYCHAKPIRTDF